MVFIKIAAIETPFGLNSPASTAPMKPIHRPNCVAATLTAVVLAVLPFSSSHGQTGQTSQLGLDANRNRISDIYEALYPVSANGATDSDGDGMSNESEAAAGTHPGRGADLLRIATLVHAGNGITASWPSVAGKVYQLQTALLPAGPWANEGAALAGTGAVVTAASPLGQSRKFLRVQVSDTDTDADGITDWEELQAGTDRYLFDTDGDGRSDRNYLESQFSAINTVNVSPVTSWANESGPRTAQFRITRHGGFLPVTVSFSTSGTAVRGTDYVLSGTSVQIPAGVTESFLTVPPLADTQMEPAETVTLNLTAGNGYQIGNSGAATITIISQGLDGEYYDSSGSGYENPLNFNPLQLAFKQHDPAVDFNWSKPAGTPPGTGNGTPDPRILDDDLWSARWTGFLYPKTSEVYQIHAIADRGVVVWVSTTPITAAPATTTGARINLWSTASPATKNSASMLSGGVAAAAGQPLYFRVDYRDTAGFTDNANIQLRWLVAKCLNLEVYIPAFAETPWLRIRTAEGSYRCPNWSTDWSEGGPIIEKEWLHVEPWPNASDEDRRWSCTQYDLTTPVGAMGPTPLIAAMRCYCCSKLGDEVEIPEELLK